MAVDLVTMPPIREAPTTLHLTRTSVLHGVYELVARGTAYARLDRSLTSSTVSTSAGGSFRFTHADLHHRFSITDLGPTGRTAVFVPLPDWPPRQLPEGRHTVGSATGPTDASTLVKRDVHLGDQLVVTVVQDQHGSRSATVDIDAAGQADASCAVAVLLCCYAYTAAWSDGNFPRRASGSLDGLIG